MFMQAAYLELEIEIGLKKKNALHNSASSSRQISGDFPASRRAEKIMKFIYSRNRHH